MNIKEKLISVTKIIGVLALFYIFTFAMLLILGKTIPNVIRGSEQTKLLIERIVTFLATLATLFVVIKLMCKTNIERLGILFTKSWLKHWAIGTLIGAVCLSFVWIIIVILGGYSIDLNIINAKTLNSLLFMLIGFLLVGYTEETLTRGIMAFVGRKSGRIFSVVVVGLLFVSMHLLSGSFTIISAINIFLSAVILFQLTWISGDLWMAIGYHFAWNFVMGVLGVPVSGKAVDSIITSNFSAKNQLINGGWFGLEASIPCVIFLSAEALFIGLIFIKHNRVNSHPTADWISWKK